MPEGATETQHPRFTVLHKGKNGLRDGVRMPISVSVHVGFTTHGSLVATTDPRISDLLRNTYRLRAGS